METIIYEGRYAQCIQHVRTDQQVDKFSVTNCKRYHHISDN